ncbi:hypothetical protein [Agrococcus jejuensis]|nr:hypothetical protein [Agrococcus jejuensis]
MIATAPRRRLALAAALVAAVALGGCVAQPPPLEPTNEQLEALALDHHAAYGDAMVGTIDVATIGVESTALLEELATPEIAAFDSSIELMLLSNGQRLVAPATATAATLRSQSLPAFEVLLCVDITTVRYEDALGQTSEGGDADPLPMVMRYEHRPGDLPLATWQALEPTLESECPPQR